MASIKSPEIQAIFENFKSKSLGFGRTVVPVANPNKELKKGQLGFEYAEHCFLGDAITLTLSNGQKVAASDYKFKLPDGLALTYGEINGLAGDFYGTSEPISDGKDAQDQAKRFIAAYNTLANNTVDQPKEATAILAVLQGEVDAVNNALEHHEDPSVVYAKLPDVTVKLEWLTIGRKSFPSYLGLASINWDHFGADARTAYNAGHSTAIKQAISGDLNGAYMMNAFADHFLEDSFSAGHLRTPRRLLHSNTDPTADVCAKFMHDEDNAIGINVKNPNGQTWTAYGDKRALDSADEQNKKLCISAVQASADEIYQAYQTKQAPKTYTAWNFAPTLDSARAPNQTLAPLFTFSSERRKDIEDRRLWGFKTDWWFWSTASECELSGWWTYPITINGPKNILPWTAVSVTVANNLRVFYQRPDGNILQSQLLNGAWVGGTSGSPIFKALFFTPLAVINWANGNEIRVYYIDDQYILQEYCYSSSVGWFPGALGKLQIQVFANTSIAAIQWNNGRSIRLYCQELGSNAIKEFVNDGSWGRGAILPVALNGSSLSAVTYTWNGFQIRLYYQAEDLSLREHCFDQTRWFPGAFNPGKAPGSVPISALVWNSNGNGVAVLNVYWRNAQNEIVGIVNNGSWGSISTIWGGLKPGAEFAAAQWLAGGRLRLVYQDDNDSLVELCNDGSSWYRGTTISTAR